MQNKNNLSMQSITGNGENDYALLLITANAEIPYTALSDKVATQGDTITLAMADPLDIFAQFCFYVRLTNKT